MKQLIALLAVALTCAMPVLPRFAGAQVSSDTLKSISTPDQVETRLSTLDFKDGAPSDETVDKVYGNLDFTHAFEAFVNTFQGVNMAAVHHGLLSIGSQYLLAMFDADKQYFDGAKTYKVTLPKGIPRRSSGR